MDWLTRLMARSMRSEPAVEPTVDRRFSHLAAAAALPAICPVRLFRRRR